MNKNPTLKEVYKTLPWLPQRQDDLRTQVLDACAILNKLGMYDVSDLIKGKNQ